MTGCPKAHQVPEKYINYMSKEFPGKKFIKVWKKIYQSNLIPISTARYSDIKLIYILHSNISIPMGNIIAK